MFPFVELQINQPRIFQLEFECFYFFPFNGNCLTANSCGPLRDFSKTTCTLCVGVQTATTFQLILFRTLESLECHVLSMAHISFNCNYFLRSLVKLKKEGNRMTQVFSTGPLVGFCLIMLTICQENAVRSWEQTRLIYFTGLSTQPNYCITNSNSFTPRRSTLISVCNTGAGVCYGRCMLTSSLRHSQGPYSTGTEAYALLCLFLRSFYWHVWNNYRQCSNDIFIIM